MKFFIRIIIVTFSINVAIPTTSHASACCASATAFGTGRLLKWEKFAIGIRSSYDSQHLSTNSLWTMAAITPEVSAFAVLPWFSDGLDDIQLGARYQFPNIGILGNLIFPSSSVSHETSWGFSLATVFEKDWQPFFAQLNLGTSWFLPTSYNRSNLSFWRWGTGQIAGVVGMELPYDLVVNLTGQYILEGARYIDGVEMKSIHHKIPISIGFSWKIDPHWMLISSISAISMDHPHFGGQLGIRYGHF